MVPAGAGKSSVAKMVADALGFEYLDTGSMYRAVALAGIHADVDWDAPNQLVAVAERVNIEIRDRRTWLDGVDVTDRVRMLDVTAKTKYAADNPEIRALMVQLQRDYASTHNDIVTEGRDQGSAVFPNAGCKIFLTATPEERARRRLLDLKNQGETEDFDRLLHDIEARDRRDAARSVGPLVEPNDAQRVVTDGLSLNEVVARLVELIRSRIISR